MHGWMNDPQWLSTSTLQLIWRRGKNNLIQLSRQERYLHHCTCSKHFSNVVVKKMQTEKCHRTSLSVGIYFHGSIQLKSFFSVPLVSDLKKMLGPSHLKRIMNFRMKLRANKIKWDGAEVGEEACIFWLQKILMQRLPKLKSL